MIHASYKVIDYDDHEEPIKVGVRFPWAASLLQESGEVIKKGIGLEYNTFTRKDTWYNFFEEKLVYNFLSYVDSEILVQQNYLNQDPD